MSSSDSNVDQEVFKGPPSLTRSVTISDEFNQMLIRRGCVRFCTCCTDCLFMQGRSETCNEGGDSGVNFQKAHNNFSLSLV